MFGKKPVEKEALEMLKTGLEDTIASMQETLKELRHMAVVMDERALEDIMKKQQVDTPYKNSWADQMKRGTMKVTRARLHPTFIEAQKLMEAQHARIGYGIRGNTTL